jgi:hypothetical protein
MRTSPLVSQPMTDQTTAADVSQPEPEGLTDKELIAVYRSAYQPTWEGEHRSQWPSDFCHISGIRAVIAADRACHGRPTPQPPVESEVAELVTLLCEVASAWEPDARLLGNMTARQFARSADLLSRLSPAQPVPVTERLPGPEDCQFNPGATTGSCWCWNPPTYAAGIGCWTFEPLEWAEDPTHWLPAYALPLP